VPKLEVIQAVLLLRGHVNKSLLNSHSILKPESIRFIPLAKMICLAVQGSLLFHND
jgi:hypothetical protein